MKKLDRMTIPETYTLANTLGRAVEATAQQMKVERPSFVLVFFGAHPAAPEFVSNCDRPTMITALRGMADRLEGKG